MYDIEGKLKRRAMLERLRGLGRAAEATSNAGSIPVPDQAPGPRHRNDAVTEAPVNDGPSPLHDYLSRRFRSSEPAGDDHTEPVAAVAVPYLEAGPYKLVADPYLEASPYTSVGAYLLTGPHDVPTAPPQVPSTNGQVGDAPQPQVESRGRVSFEEIPLQLPLDRMLVDDEPADPDQVDAVSSAATIADLLRQGADRLFFAPSPRPSAPASPAIPATPPTPATPAADSVQD